MRYDGTDCALMVSEQSTLGARLRGGDDSPSPVLDFGAAFVQRYSSFFARVRFFAPEAKQSSWTFDIYLFAATRVSSDSRSLIGT